MLRSRTTIQFWNVVAIFQEKLENCYHQFRDKYKQRFDKYRQISDISFLGAYLTSTTLDAIVTLQNIGDHTDESHQFTSFLMENYGVDEGLLRMQGIEALQLAALIGFAYIIQESWKYFKGEEIDTEIRFGLVYLYMAIGISKHIQGILSWL
jgi:hypothetical protein